MGGDVDAKNGDVEIAWDSSEVGADTEIEYVPLMRVEHPSLPSPQPNIAPLNQRAIEGIPIPREPWVWNDPKFNDFVKCWLAAWVVFWFVTGLFIPEDWNPFEGGGELVYFHLLLIPVIIGRFCWVTWTNYRGYD